MFSTKIALCCAHILAAVVLSTSFAGQETPTCGAHAQTQDDGSDADDDLANVQLLQQEVRVEQTGLVKGSDLIVDRISKMGGTASTTTPDPTGVTRNTVGDMEAFIVSMLIYCVIVVFCFLLFSLYLRRAFPEIYQNNDRKGIMPEKLPDTTFGWITVSLKLDINTVANCISLDHALMLKFCNLSIKLSGMIALPMLCVMGPMNCAFGGNRAGEDHLSYFSFGNVKDGSWLYFIHAVVVWAVVIFVVHSINAEHREFMDMRFRWMRELPDLRANTVMVENIPKEYQSDERLKAFIMEILPHTDLKSACIAKDTYVLAPLVASLKDAKLKLREAELLWQNSGEDKHCKPMIGHSILGSQVEAIPYYEKQVSELTVAVEAERKRIHDEASKPGGVNTSSAFLTFEHRCDAELALRLDGVSASLEEWIFEIPPHPKDVIWTDLTQDPDIGDVRQKIGYLCIAGLFFAYMPIVVSVTNIAKLINMGLLQPLWASVAPTIGLQIMVSLLPTFLCMIFKTFFQLKGCSFSQQKLQAWYFWFQIFFVVLAPVVGQDVSDFTKTMVQNPLGIFLLLGNTMPESTHFFANFMILQWVTHTVNLLRHVPLAKFLMFSRIYEPEEAREKAELENQDYYGVGGRSARWTSNMVICIIFCTISPPMSLLVFIDVLIMRVVYGHLFCYAETRKVDSGGAFWVMQMSHLFVALIIYTMLMTGVLYNRAATGTPATIVLPTFFYSIYQLMRFHDSYAWEKLPFDELMRRKKVAGNKRHMEGEYVQPEFKD